MARAPPETLDGFQDALANLCSQSSSSSPSSLPLSSSATSSSFNTLWLHIFSLSAPSLPSPDFLSFITFSPIINLISASQAPLLSFFFPNPTLPFPLLYNRSHIYRPSLTYHLSYFLSSSYRTSSSSRDLSAIQSAIFIDSVIIW